MPLDTATYFGLLDLTNPRGSDSRTLADDFHRVMRESCQIQFPNLTDEVTSTHQDLNLVSGIATTGAKLMTGDGGTTVMFVYNDTAPTGWTVTEPDANLRNLVIGPGGSGGTIRGTDDPTNYSETLVLTVSGVTAGEATHTHSFSSSTGSPTVGDENVAAGSISVARQAHEHDFIGTTDSGSVHTHGVGSLDVNDPTTSFVPRYARGRLVQLDV